MRRDELEQILRNQEEVTPSPGFVHRVMRAAYQEADTPKPIPFPWKRAVPGIGAAAFVRSLLCISLVRNYQAPEPASAISLSEFAGNFVSAWNTSTRSVPGSWMIVGWIFIALWVTFLCVKLPMRLLAEKT